MTIKTGTLLKDNTENPAILDSIEALRSAGFEDNIIAQFSQKAVNILNDYAELIGEGTEFRFGLTKGILSLKLTVNVVIACFMAAHLTGMNVTTSFLAALILVTMELSIASPGTAAAWTIMLETLSMPTGYVGLFTIYRMFTANFGAGCTEAYLFMKEIEAAHKMDAIQPQGEIAPAEM